MYNIKKDKSLIEKAFNHYVEHCQRTDNNIDEEFFDDRFNYFTQFLIPEHGDMDNHMVMLALHKVMEISNEEYTKLFDVVENILLNPCNYLDQSTIHGIHIVSGYILADDKETCYKNYIKAVETNNALLISKPTKLNIPIEWEIENAFKIYNLPKLKVDLIKHAFDRRIENNYKLLDLLYDSIPYSTIDETCKRIKEYGEYNKERSIYL